MVQQISTCSPWRTARRSRRMPKRGFDPMGTYAGAVREEPQHMGRARIREVHGKLSPVEGTPSWSRGAGSNPCSLSRCATRGEELRRRVKEQLGLSSIQSRSTHHTSVFLDVLRQVTLTLLTGFLSWYFGIILS